MDGDDEIPLGKGPHNDRRLSMEAFGKVDKDSFYGFEEFALWFAGGTAAAAKPTNVASV